MLLLKFFRIHQNKIRAVILIKLMAKIKYLDANMRSELVNRRPSVTRYHIAYSRMRKLERIVCLSAVGVTIKPLEISRLQMIPFN